MPRQDLPAIPSFLCGVLRRHSICNRCRFLYFDCFQHQSHGTQCIVRIIRSALNSIRATFLSFNYSKCLWLSDVDMVLSSEAQGSKALSFELVDTSFSGVFAGSKNQTQLLLQLICRPRALSRGRFACPCFWVRKLLLVHSRTGVTGRSRDETGLFPLYSKGQFTVVWV